MGTVGTNHKDPTSEKLIMLMQDGNIYSVYLLSFEGLEKLN